MIRAWVGSIGLALLLLAAGSVQGEERLDPGTEWEGMSLREHYAWLAGWESAAILAVYSMVDIKDRPSKKLADEVYLKLRGRASKATLLKVMSQIYEDAANAPLAWSTVAMAAVEILNGADKESVLRERRQIMASALEFQASEESSE